MNIGQFTKSQETGDFAGRAAVLFGPSSIHFEKVQAEGKKPGYIIHVDGSEVGAAWEKTSEKGNSYLSVSFDLPTQPAPIFGALFINKDGSTYSLVWDRPEKKAA